MKKTINEATTRTKPNLAEKMMMKKTNTHTETKMKEELKSHIDAYFESIPENFKDYTKQFPPDDQPDFDEWLMSYNVTLDDRQNFKDYTDLVFSSDVGFEAEKWIGMDRNDLSDEEKEELEDYVQAKIDNIKNEGIPGRN